MNSRSRKNESLVYLALWGIVIALYIIDAMRSRAQYSEELMNMAIATWLFRALIPFMLLFALHNYLLIPKLFLKNRYKSYACFTTLAIGLLWTYQTIDFIYFREMIPPPDDPFPMPHRHPHSLLPMPLFLDFTYGLFVVGCNLAIALIFQRFDDKLEKESLTNANIQSQLDNLKSQINPHFYMNMLNNIHGMIEIKPEVAQTMVLDLSRLMRYMLYESSKSGISLRNEIDFLQNYIGLMRVRYDSSKVKIHCHFPGPTETTGIILPPLLFLVFVENAFKHGVSYRLESFVSLSIDIEDSAIIFNCLNSNHAAQTANGQQPGIGLKNIRQRLALLYGDRANLDIRQSSQTFSVTLSIPRHENKNANC